jgi:hypothetical protein
MKTSDRKSLVEGYVQRGWFIFPCKVGGKQPATRSGLYAATNDLVTVRRWWKRTDYNIGINCGASGLCVVDLDPPNGVTRWLDMCMKFGTDAMDTYAVGTPRLGLHLYYRLPAGRKAKSSNGQIAEGVDIKSDGGYVVAAGSVLDGREYEAQDERELTELPGWLLTMVEKRDATEDEKIEKAMNRAVVQQQMRDQPNDVIKRRLDRLLSATSGARNETLNEVAYGLFLASDDSQLGLVETELIAAGLAVGLTNREIRDTLKSAMRSAMRDK